MPLYFLKAYFYLCLLWKTSLSSIDRRDLCMKVKFDCRDLFTFHFESEHLPKVKGKRMSLISTRGKSSLFHFTVQWGSSLFVSRCFPRQFFFYFRFLSFRFSFVASTVSFFSKGSPSKHTQVLHCLILSLSTWFVSCRSNRAKLSKVYPICEFLFHIKLCHFQFLEKVCQIIY